MGIILANRTVTHQHHYFRETIGQTGIAQKTGNPVGLFLIGKAQFGMIRGGNGRGVRRGKHQVGIHRGRYTFTYARENGVLAFGHKCFCQ